MELSKALCGDLKDQPELQVTLEQLSDCYGIVYDDEISGKLT